MPQNNLKSSIAIIGCGDVGSTLAYSLLLQPICNEIILVDPKKDLVEAQVRDLNDASFRGSSGIRVKVGDHKEAGNADIIVVTAGAAQKKGEWWTGQAGSRSSRRSGRRLNALDSCDCSPGM